MQLGEGSGERLYGWGSQEEQRKKYKKNDIVTTARHRDNGKQDALQYNAGTRLRHSIRLPHMQ